MVEIIFVALFALLLLGFMLAPQKSPIDDHIKQISRHAEKHHNNDISIERVWVSGDRQSSMYRVTYLDSDGVRHRARCCIFAGDEQIYWNKPIETLSNSQISTLSHELSQSVILRPSSKEEIISDLADEVEQLKLELEEMKGAGSAEKGWFRPNSVSLPTKNAV